MATNSAPTRERLVQQDRAQNKSECQQRAGRSVRFPASLGDDDDEEQDEGASSEPGPHQHCDNSSSLWSFILHFRGAKTQLGPAVSEASAPARLSPLLCIAAKLTTVAGGCDGGESLQKWNGRNRARHVPVTSPPPVSHLPQVHPLATAYLDVTCVCLGCVCMQHTLHVWRSRFTLHLV